MALFSKSLIGVAVSLGIASATLASSVESPSVDVSNGPQPSVIAERAEVTYAFRQYGNADFASVSYASPEYNGGCSSTMIGPNIVLTAAHCGPAEGAANQNANLRFVTYRDNETQRNQEIFTCRRLIHGWPLHDLSLAWCDPNAAGINPGDKYGYLDVETRAPLIGDRVYSIWWNPVTQGATGSAMVPLFSSGFVKQTNATIWGGILPGWPAGKPVGIRMDTWAAPGASGGGNVDINTHRLLVGPTTLAGATEGPSKHAWSMNTYFQTTLLAPGFHAETGMLEQIKASNFPSNIFNFSSYVGGVDKNLNAIFDVQEDIERWRGENHRTTYALDFDNRRRNALWTTPGQSIDFAQARLPVSQSGAALVASHARLNLKPNTNYRLGVSIRTGSTASPLALNVGFEEKRWTSPRVNFSTSPQPSPLFRTGLLRTGAGFSGLSSLVFRTTAAFTGDISGVQLVEDGSTVGFDTRDEREGWLTGQGRASVLPQGVTSSVPGAVPDFALRVEAVNGGQALWTWSRNILFLTGRAQRLCFKVRAQSPTQAIGEARVFSNGQLVHSFQFPLGNSWATQCTDNILTPSADSALLFSSTGSSLGTGYLIDDLRLDLDPLHEAPIDVLE
ncbi:MAG: trypsin-like peptidase domain-containing protein [Tahibacter sp.]